MSGLQLQSFSGAWEAPPGKVNWHYNVPEPVDVIFDDQGTSDSILGGQQGETSLS